MSHNRRVATIAAAIRVYGGPIMRTTVGPLPPAVYWRRRAVVLGAVLLGIIVLFVSCSGDDKKDPRGQGASSSQKPTPAPNDSSPDPEPSFLDSAPPGNGPTLPAPGDLESPGDNDPAASGVPTLGSGNGTGQNSNVNVPADGSCADSEMSVTPIPATTTIKRGTNVDLSMIIKNKGTRTCARDIGAASQELYIVNGARKYWSSDTCSTAQGNDLRQLRPGEERTFKVTWNGRQSNSCASGVASGPNPPPGQFQLLARLGTLVSSPVTLTIVS